MRRSVLSVVAALMLVVLPGGSLAVAAPPVVPQIGDVSVRWGWYEWDDGTTMCTLIADAALDPGFTKGPRVFATAYVHYMWVGDGGGTWQELRYWQTRLGRGDTLVHTYLGFGDDGGYYVVDRVGFELTTVRGEVLTSREVPTANTCLNG